MLKIDFYSNNEDNSQKIVDRFIKEAQKKGLVFSKENPDVIVTIGGDGTLLGAFKKYQNMLDKIRFVGLHTGHLGFYTDWTISEVDQLIDSLVKDNGQSVSYPLLEVQLTYKNKEQKRYLALNEATIKRPGKTLITDVYLENNKFESFRGDGLSIATPSGSTAYNKANGGAILHPSISALQMSEIASINNKIFRTIGSPIVIPKDQAIILYPKVENYMLTVDQDIYWPNDLEYIQFKVADTKVKFAAYRHLDFWTRVKNSFIGQDNG